MLKAKIGAMLYALMGLEEHGAVIDTHKVQDEDYEIKGYFDDPICHTNYIEDVKNWNIWIDYNSNTKLFDFKYWASRPVRDWVDYYSRQVVNFLTSHYSSVKIHNWELFLERINEGVGRYPDSMNALEEAINKSDIFVMLNRARQYLQIHGIELESNPWYLCKYPAMFTNRDSRTGELYDEYDIRLIERFAENVDKIRCNAIDPNKIKILAYRPFGNLMTACEHHKRYVSWDIYRLGLILAIVAGIESDCFSTVEWAYEEMILVR